LEPGKTLNLGEVLLTNSDRNPLPFIDVFLGKWNSTCYYNESAMGSDSTNLENPETGTIDIVSLTEVSYTGEVCLLRTLQASRRPFSKFIPLADGVLGLVLSDSGGTDYYTHSVTSYNNNRIVIQIDDAGMTNVPTYKILERVIE
jgi:hypothetical protein